MSRFLQKLFWLHSSGDTPAYRLGVAIAMLALVSAGLCLYLQVYMLASLLTIKDGGDTERNWLAAQQYCSDQGQRLATISELTALMLSGKLPARNSDYWSSTQLGSYAFGINMKWSILSFDEQRDRDHFICVLK